MFDGAFLVLRRSRRTEFGIRGEPRSDPVQVLAGLSRGC